MVHRRHLTSQWTHLLANIVFLQTVAVSASHAVEVNQVTSKAVASTTNATTIAADDIEATDDTALLQLNLDRDRLDSVDDFENDGSELDLYLDVNLNGAHKGLVHFYYRDEQLLASAAILQQLSFIVPPDSSEPIPLNHLPNLKIDYNARRQTLKLIAPLSMLNLDTTILNTRTNKRPKPSASPGMLLNYNLYGSQSKIALKTLVLIPNYARLMILVYLAQQRLPLPVILPIARIASILVMIGTAKLCAWIPVGAAPTLIS